jgi:uncharacterized protein GlcG (DUF336 family)
MWRAFPGPGATLPDCRTSSAAGHADRCALEPHDALAGLEFGRLKAYTARTRGQTSLEFKNLTDKPENAYLKQIPNVVAVGGGVPIKVGNEVIGAVGVSGAPGGEKDEACANAGIAKVAASLN